MIQVQEGKRTLKLLNIGLAALPPGALNEGKIVDPSAIAFATQKLAQHLKIKQKIAAICISGYEVMIKQIEMPAMSDDELDARMREELGQYIPYNLDEVNVSHQKLGVDQDNPNRTEVLLVAAKKESVDQYTSVVDQAGLEAAVLDVDFFALSNAYEATYGKAETERVALLDIGSSKTNLNIFHQGVPAFNRDIPVGGIQITEKLEGRFGLSREDAERVKLGEMRGMSKEEVQSVFTEVTNDWLDEVQRIINFYYNNYTDSKIDRILLSGGSCRIPGLDNLFQKELGMPVEIFNPLTRLDFDPKRIDPAYVDYVGPQMAVALGLGLRRLDEK
jgi:type IV pilus assembly protein PilM